MGVWACRADVMAGKHRLISDGMIRPAEPGELSKMPTPMVLGTTAIIRVDDVMMKHRSKYGGVSTLDVRRQGRWALSEFKAGRIKSLLLDVDSPGGHVEGQEELVQDFLRIASEMPVYSYIRDMGCSAGYWFPAAVSRRIAANRMSTVGSIGAFCVLYDTSKMYEAAGVKVIPVASGPEKGLGIDGTEVDEKTINSVQREIDAIYGFFVDDVKAGRPQWKGDKADGSVVFGDEALAIGLIDEVTTFDTFLSKIENGEVMTEPQTQVEMPVGAEVEDEVIGISAETGSPILAAKLAEEVAPEDGDDEECQEGDEECEKKKREKEMKALRDENELLRAELESHTQEMADKALAARERARVQIVKQMNNAGIAIKADSMDELVAQMAALGNAASPMPTKVAVDTDPKKEAAKVLRKYQEKHGTAKGGALFAKEQPELLKILNGK